MKREQLLTSLQECLKDIAESDNPGETVQTQYPAREIPLIKELLGEIAADQTNAYMRFLAQRVLNSLG